MDVEYSELGSSNIILKINFDRGHIYRGYYLINSKFKEDFENYLPVAHLKVRSRCYFKFRDGLKLLSQIEKNDDEYCGQFISFLWEEKGINFLNLSDQLHTKLAPSNYRGASLIFLHDDDITIMIGLLRAFLECFDWSKNNDFQGYATQEPIYSLQEYLVLSQYLANVKRWFKI